MYIEKKGSECLSLVAHSVERGLELNSFIDDMWKTLIASKGIGLAANQVGYLLRVIVINVNGLSTEIINPVITKRSGRTKLSSEGCLSFPGKQVKVKRDSQIVVEGFDRNWNPIKKKCRALTAFCVQHEIDHLNGITIVKNN
jgi:peptide deformylase